MRIMPHTSRVDGLMEEMESLSLMPHGVIWVMTLPSWRHISALHRYPAAAADSFDAELHVLTVRTA